MAAGTQADKNNDAGWKSDLNLPAKDGRFKTAVRFYSLNKF